MGKKPTEEPDEGAKDTLPPPTRRYEPDEALALLAAATRPTDPPAPAPRKLEEPQKNSSPSTDRFNLVMLASRNDEAFDDPPPSTQVGLRTLAARIESQDRIAAAKSPLDEMRERHSLGDFSGALELSDQILETDPTNAEALRCRDKARDVLVKMYSARLGARTGVPNIIVPRTQLRWLSLDHKSGFMLSLVDGEQTIEAILDMSGMPILDALRILCHLIGQRIIALKP